jgi:hypothetical protein
MKSDQKRFYMALGLYIIWLVGLATMAATSAARPVNLQNNAAAATTPDPAPPVLKP